ncbi:MAG: hypothetical protein DMF86_17115 [Acidobacteria bacterium]|nr:MAG: hypothetical protein DMF86_17115 [Acidobacteriota bacterium]
MFAAAAAVVLWQNTRVKVLWDLSYILEHAYRIALGDRPYHEFVMPHAPLTFVLQAAIMRVFGDGLLPHVWYCAVIAGLTALLTYRLLLVEFGGAPWRALTLAAPVTFLNGYCILPQPFYDPDCTFFVLLALCAIVWARRHETAAWRHFAAGVLIVIPLFVKQNIGIAAFAAAHAFCWLSAARNPGERRAYAFCAAGSAAALLCAAFAIEAWTGLGAYWEWTVSYAAARRWPRAQLWLLIYGRLRTWLAIAGAVAGYLVIRNRRGSRVALVFGLALIALPLAESTRTMLRWGIGARSYVWWGLAFVAGSLAAVDDSVRARFRFEAALPLVAVAIAHGAFASQGVFDSAYGVWPFLMIALAPLAVRLFHAVGREEHVIASAVVGFAGIVLLVLGYRHLASHERVGFADVSGPVARATLPSLRGLATPGTYVPDFERLLRRTADVIPARDGVVVVPGEDPFFFASKRRPRFPVVLFDDTVTPYDRPTLMKMMEERQITWVIVKTRLQLRNGPWRPLEAFVEQDLAERYDVFDVLPRYTILRRR